jgi:arylsulfatase A-like enzyme
VAREHPEHYESVLATIWPTAIPEYAAYGPEQVDLRARIHEIREGFQWATPEFPRNNGSFYTLPFPEPVSQTAWITRHALAFIRETDPAQPLYAHISYVQPHSPFHPPGEYMGTVDASRIPAPAPAEWVDDPHAPGYFADKAPLDEDWAYARHCYFADIVHLDAQLGKVLDALEQTGRLENTYLIFLSDHGELLCDHGFRGKEERHYDACIRVPLIVAGPGLKGGQVRDEYVQHEDLCPTVLDACGVSLPLLPKTGPYLKVEQAEIEQLPGRSLLGLCRGEDVAWREAAYSESYNAIWSIAPGDWARTIRTRAFRYTFYAADNGEQMFHLPSDPDEQHNVVADPAYAAERLALRDRLLELIVMQDYPKTRRELYALGVH